MLKNFQRRKENFKCKQCGTEVAGNGYTDHCPECLWSRHVDINPGDRAAECRGMMQPVGIEVKSGEKKIIYSCLTCGKMQKNKVADSDNFETILQVMKKRGEGLLKG